MSIFLNIFLHKMQLKLTKCGVDRNIDPFIFIKKTWKFQNTVTFMAFVVCTAFASLGGSSHFWIEDDNIEPLIHLRWQWTSISILGLLHIFLKVIVHTLKNRWACLRCYHLNSIGSLINFKVLLPYIFLTRFLIECEGNKLT